MRDPKHPGKLAEEFKRRFVAFYDGGKPAAEIMREHDLGKSTFQRRARLVHETGSTRAADNRAPEESRLLELEREDARPVEAAFPDVAFPLDEAEASRSDGGPELRDAEIDAPLSAFGVERSVSRPGNPRDDAVVESTNRVLERELVRGRSFASEKHLRTELFDWVSWHDNCRLHPTLGYMTPVGFREAGLRL